MLPSVWYVLAGDVARVLAWIDAGTLCAERTAHGDAWLTSWDLPPAIDAVRCEVDPSTVFGVIPQTRRMVRGLRTLRGRWNNQSLRKITMAQYRLSRMNSVVWAEMAPEGRAAVRTPLRVAPIRSLRGVDMSCVDTPSL
jgi:hypothetical protein